VIDVQGPVERSLLVVGEGRDEVMIPMVDGIVVGIDTPGRRIVVDLPEGLRSVNSATRASDSE
jgi:ribosomal 30S subunit maturation factor RimM